MSEFLNNLNKALVDERWEDYEEQWLDALESDKVPFTEFLRAAERALEQGQGARAGSVLALLAVQAETMPAGKKQQFYETLVSCLPKNQEYRDALLKLYEKQYGDVPGYETYVKTADLRRTANPAEAIQHFANMIHYLPGSYVFHRSGWGVGEIKDVSNLENAAVIDFEGKPGHRVQIDAIAEICDRLPPNDFRVLAWQRPDELKALAESDPGEVVKAVLRTSNRPLALSRIREALIGKAVASGSWSKWWTRARNALKKDSEVAVTAKKSPEYFLLEGPEGIAASLERRLHSRSLKETLRILRETIADVETEEELAAVKPFFERLKKTFRMTDGPPELLLEAILFMRHQKIDTSDLLTAHDILGRSDHPGDVLNLLPRQEDQREVIDLLRTQDEDGWEEFHTDLLLRADDGPRRYLIELMKEDGRDAEIDELAKEIGHFPRKAPLFFLWIVRRVGRGDTSAIPSLASAKPIDLYLKAVSLLNDFTVRQAHDNSAELNLYVKRYRQHLGGRPFKLLISVVQSADLSAVRSIYHHIEAAPGFSGSTRQGLLAAVLREQPDVLASTGDTRTTTFIDDSVIYSTDAGIAKRRAELAQIRNEKLPAIFKLIGEAAEFGDLSENAEFTSAIEERENLNRRAMEIQADLDRVRRIEPSEASTDRVSLGSRVKLLDLVTREEYEYSLLGPWDGGPEDGVISYLSPIGRAMLDRVPAEVFEVELPDGTSKLKVEGISIHGGANV